MAKQNYFVRARHRCRKAETISKLW